MTGTRKCNIKDLLPCQERKSCQGRLAEHRKIGEGKGVRAHGRERHTEAARVSAGSRLSARARGYEHHPN